ncbi:MAG: hypothetical protein WCI94_19570, partial [Rhodospirillales bacterium]
VYWLYLRSANSPGLITGAADDDPSGIATYSQAGAGFGFNMLSLSSDPDKRRPDLHYASPTDTLDFCLTRFGRHVALLQDYGLWEFTILVRHS